MTFMCVRARFFFFFLSCRVSEAAMRVYVSDCGPHVARGSAVPSEEPIGPFHCLGAQGSSN